MRDEDRRALRTFYQTLARSSFTDEQVALYWALIKGADARRDWVVKYGDTVGVPPYIRDILASDIPVTKEDVAYIAAAEIATKVAPTAQSFLQRVIGVIFSPFRWLFGG